MLRRLAVMRVQYLEDCQATSQWWAIGMATGGERWESTVRGSGCWIGTATGLRLPGVRTLICPLLTPELADQISRAEKVIFVDAAVDAPNAVQWRRLEPNETSQLMAHAADPRTMLALSRDVFGRVPEAWWLTIPAVDLGFREALSPEVQRSFTEAVEKDRKST